MFLENIKIISSWDKRQLPPLRCSYLKARSSEACFFPSLLLLLQLLTFPRFPVYVSGSENLESVSVANFGVATLAEKRELQGVAPWWHCHRRISDFSLLVVVGPPTRRRRRRRRRRKVKLDKWMLIAECKSWERWATARRSDNGLFSSHPYREEKKILPRFTSLRELLRWRIMRRWSFTAETISWGAFRGSFSKLMIYCGLCEKCFWFNCVKELKGLCFENLEHFFSQDNSNVMLQITNRH